MGNTSAKTLLIIGASSLSIAIVALVLAATVLPALFAGPLGLLFFFLFVGGATSLVGGIAAGRRERAAAQRAVEAEDD